MVDKTKEELAQEHGQGQGGGQVVIEKPETSWSTVKTLGLVGMIVGGAVLIGAGVAFIFTEINQANAVNEQNTANSQASNCPSLNPNSYPGMMAPPGACASAVSYHEQALSAQTAAIALLIPGAVVGVTGLVMFLVGGNVTKAPEKPAASWRVVPAISPNYAGLGVVGTF